MSVDLAVIVMMLGHGGLGAGGGFRGVIVVIIVIGIFRCRIAEQRAFQFLVGHYAASGFRQVEQLQRLVQQGAHGGDLGLVGVGGGRVFEAHQVHRRALQFQFQGLPVQRGVQPTNAMLVGAEAAMFVGFMGLGGNQREQGKRQGEQQVAHGVSPGTATRVFCYVIL